MLPLAIERQTDSLQAVFDVWAAVDWSKTSRGGTQYGLFRVANDGPGCSSIYGLCE